MKCDGNPGSLSFPALLVHFFSHYLSANEPGDDVGRYRGATNVLATRRPWLFITARASLAFSRLLRVVTLLTISQRYCCWDRLVSRIPDRLVGLAREQASQDRCTLRDHRSLL